MNFQEAMSQIAALRHTDPLRSLALAWKVAESCSGTDLAQSLGSVASSLRAVGAFEKAGEILDIAFARADDGRESRGVVADLHRRLCLLYVSRSMPSQALAAADCALALAASVDDRVGIGRIYIAKGSAQHWLGEYAESNDSNLSALLYLTAPYDLMGAHLNMALNFLFLGKFSEHEAALASARRQPVPKALGLLARWVEGEKELALGCPERAGESFADLSAFYFESRQFAQAALASVLGVRAWIKAGKISKARDLGDSMTKLLISLGTDKVVEAAVGSVILQTRSASLGSLASKAVEAELLLRRALARPRLPYPQPSMMT